MMRVLMQMPGWAWAVIGAMVVIDTITVLIILRLRRGKRANAAAAQPAAAADASPILPDRSSMWFYASHGAAVGPYRFEQMVEMARGGMFSPDDMVCMQKDQRWIAAGRVVGLFSDEQ